MPAFLDDLVHPFDQPDAAPPVVDVAAEAAPLAWSDDALFRSLAEQWASLEPLGDWVALARCAELPTEAVDAYFFGLSEDLAYTRRFCNGCPVQADCRDYARGNDIHGIWGGETRAERHNGTLRWAA